MTRQVAILNLKVPPLPIPSNFAMANTGPEDFGLSSSDEADLAELTSIVEAVGNRKRSTSQPATLSVLKKPKLPAPKYPTTSDLARKILKETWGYPSFRLKQEEAISRLIHGGSAVVVFPTGGGKSLVYQVPALAFDEYEADTDSQALSGLTVVVSPLIALMKVGCFVVLGVPEQRLISRRIKWMLSRRKVSKPPPSIPPKAASRFSIPTISYDAVN